MNNELQKRVCRKMCIEPNTDLNTPEWAGRLLAMLSNCGLFPACKQPLGGRTGYSARVRVWEVEIIDPRRMSRQIDGSQVPFYGGASESLAEAICLAIDIMPDAVLNGSERMDS